MQKSADTKMIRGELADLLREAFKHHEHCEAARSSVMNAQQVALWHGWQAGIRLNRMKEILGAGDWLDWLDLNFCRPRKVSQRTAYIYMKIDSDNAALRDKVKLKRVANGKPDFQLLRRLKHDTVRKYAIQFVPEKHQPRHDGNEKFPRLVSFINIANEYNRLRYRHTSGLQAVDFDKARHETVELFEFLRWLHGETEANPWAPPPGR